MSDPFGLLDGPAAAARQWLIDVGADSSPGWGKELRRS